MNIVLSQWQYTIDYNNNTQYVYNRQWDTITIHNDIQLQYTMKFNYNTQRATIAIHNKLQLQCTIPLQCTIHSQYTIGYNIQ